MTPNEHTSVDALAKEEAIQARQNERTTVTSMIKEREGWLAGCERTIELLAPEWERFEAREGHDLYTSRMYADHVSEARKHRAELLLLKPLDPLHQQALAAGYATVAEWVAAMVGALEGIRSHIIVERNDDGKIAGIGHDSAALPKIVAILDATMRRAALTKVSTDV